MPSNRPKHIEASSTDPPGGDTTKPRALWNLSVDQSDSAGMKKTALSDLSEILMEQIVDEQNVEQAWRKVKANQGASGPDGITLDEFPQGFRSQWPTIRQQRLEGTYQFIGYGGQMRVSPKNLDKFKTRVRELTRRSNGISMTTRLKALGYYLRGWTGYFCLVPIKSFFGALDKWVRRRIRSCYWKQWRKPSARIRNLMSLGLDRNEADPFGSCSRGAWFMSQCQSVQSTLTNLHLSTTGLVSLLEVWSKLAPKR